MYIPPFWCGVIAILVSEAIALVAYAIYLNRKGK